jgi:Holliday junction resolvasome RuvABC endonuclease subunit
MVFAGIDYSLTSPAICIHTGDVWDYENCVFYYLVNNQKYLNREDKKYVPSIYPSHGEDVERFHLLAEWSMGNIRNHSVDYVGIEGYAFGAVGRVFQIAENGGLLKHKLWINNFKVATFPPTVIKKFATGKGNSNKEAMVESFETETNVSIREKCGITNKQWNPISDIVDAYYIAKFHFYDMKENI